MSLFLVVNAFLLQPQMQFLQSNPVPDSFWKIDGKFMA